jgi:peptidoglycan/xylan/chitin deacetylase (PgdA/CDA1 family)
MRVCIEHDAARFIGAWGTKKMRFGAVLCCVLAIAAGGASVTAAHAGACPGHPDALGVSRILTVDPAQFPRVGTMQYARTLDLADHEVVLTFDDGPLPPYTNEILDILASECVKATYFIVGRMARAYPAVLRRVAAEGHTIGTHSQNHPFTFNSMSLAQAQREIEQGISSTATALAGTAKVAPFFRIPGLLRAGAVENYLASRGIAAWSADFPADDWIRKVSDKEIARRALSRLEAKGKGILLLHDIHPATVLALPTILRGLKERGYRIVHVVPAGFLHGEPEIWAFNPGRVEEWPKLRGIKATADAALPAPSLANFGAAMPPPPRSRAQAPHGHRKGAKRAPSVPAFTWPAPDAPARAETAALPAADIRNLHLPRVDMRIAIPLRPAIDPAGAGTSELSAAGKRTELQPGRWPFPASAAAE